LAASDESASVVATLPATQPIGQNQQLQRLKTDFKRRLIGRSMSGKLNGVVRQDWRLIQNCSQCIVREVYLFIICGSGSIAVCPLSGKT
jgi:hypothetical protein